MSIDYDLKLYEKMKAEQDRYREWLLNQPPEEILRHTFEYTIKEDILLAMENMSLEPMQAKRLLKSLCPLDDVYKEFCTRETGHMDILRDCIEYRANASIHRISDRESR